LPDISALNGTAIDNVAEFDGLTVTAAAPAFLLDTYTGAAAAYSVRKLRSAYVGSCMRVREDGTDTETDIGFDANGDLDTAAIGTHCGSNNGFVVTWYEQSTNGRDIEQPTAGSPSLQPKIYDGTTQSVVTDGTSSIPAIYFDGSNALGSSSFTTVSQPLTVFHSLTLTQAFGGTKYIWSLQGFSGGVNNMADNGTKWKYWYGGSLDRNVGVSGIGQHLLTSLADGTDSTVWQNGSMVIEGRQDAGSVGMDQIYLGGWNSTINQFDGYINEWIIYPTDQDAAGNRSGIEENINSEYLIYQPTDAPTSGLLYDYGSATGGTDAAAAYSVRQLSDKAVICMRIRRDMGAGNPGDDDETNIGFDANGDLDTQAISDFCGTGTGFVTRWWDQSVNGNHLDQPVGGTGSNSLQPQIYNGTAVITENGKPALSFDGVLDQFPIDNTGLDIGNLSVFIVTKHNTTSQTSIVLSMSGGTSPTNKRWYVGYQDLGDFNFGYASVSKAVSTTATTDQQLSTMIAGTTQGNMSAFIDGSLIGTATRDTGISSDQQAALGTFNNQFYANAKVQEFIYWSADQSTNRTGIETNVMTHFNIP